MPRNKSRESEREIVELGLLLKPVVILIIKTALLEGIICS
jgi:hypothetical protein